MKRLFLKIKNPEPHEIKSSIEKAKYIEQKQQLLYQDYSDIYDVFKDLHN